MWTRLTLPRVSVEILSGRTGYALPSTCEWLINRAYASCWITLAALLDLIVDWGWFAWSDYPSAGVEICQESSIIHTTTSLYWGSWCFCFSYGILDGTLMDVTMVSASSWTLYTLSHTKIEVHIGTRSRAWHTALTIEVGFLERAYFDAWISYNLLVLYFAQLFQWLILRNNKTMPIQVINVFDHISKDSVCCCWSISHSCNDRLDSPFYSSFASATYRGFLFIFAGAWIGCAVVSFTLLAICTAMRRKIEQWSISWACNTLVTGGIWLI
jgi:hypothetical protein